MVLEPNLRPWRLGPNESLIGDLGGRQKLNTPALIVDVDQLDINISKMAQLAQEKGVALRPHTKCHKSVEIAKRQIQAGAQGICCATIGEAEVMAGAGIDDILVTSPLVDYQKLQRAASILARHVRLSLVVDNPLTARQMSDVFEAIGLTPTVLIDIDPGMGRTGAANQRLALELARMVDRLPGLRFGGVQCYAGHIQHVEDPGRREEADLATLGSLQVLCDEIRSMGLDARTISGGGTGTHAIDLSSHVLTELQVGSYVFMDCQYNKVWAHTGLRPPFDVSLFVQATVVSANQTGYVTCDAGLKHFAVDGGVPFPVRGVEAGATYAYAGDEYGVILEPGVLALPLGHKVELIVPHCDPTVNLYNYYHCVREDALVDIWPVDARGA